MPFMCYIGLLYFVKGLCASLHVPSNSYVPLSKTVNCFLPSGCKLLLIRVSAKHLKCIKMLTIRLNITDLYLQTA